VSGEKRRSHLWTRWKQLAQGRSGAAATVQAILTALFLTLANIVTGVLTARMLGPDGRGEQLALTLWPALFAQLSTLGLPSALIYRLKTEPQEASRLFAAAISLGLLLGLTGMGIGMMVIPHQLAQYPPEVIRAAQWLLLFTPTMLVALILSASLLARDELFLYNRVRILGALLLVMALAALAFLRGLTPLHSACALVAYGLPGDIWMLWRQWRRFAPCWDQLPPRWRSLLHFGLRSYGVDVLTVLAQTLDQFLILRLLAPKFVGLYVVAVSMSGILNIVHQSVVRVLYPKASGRSVAEVTQLTGRVTRLCLLLTGLAGGVLVWIGPFLLRRLYGAEFDEASGVFRILVVAVVLNSAAWILGQAFLASGKPGALTALHGCGVVTSVLLMLLLVPPFGLLGAGVAALGAAGARLLFAHFSYPSVLGAPLPSLQIERADLVWARQSWRQRQE
jgi:O-antigen/teichoic acid export membrane protein